MRIRTFIAFTMFFLQQWAGQNSISYYAPQIFASIGLKGVSVGLLASGIYGLVKIVSTSIFIFVGIERTGRSAALGWGGLGMSLFLWIVGAIFNTHPPDPKALSPSGASIGMAVCIYLFVIPYCFGWGPVPWVVSDDPLRRLRGMLRRLTTLSRFFLSIAPRSSPCVSVPTEWPSPLPLSGLSTSLCPR
jgi:hypothetical protein